MDGGAKGGGQPGVKKNKSMNQYASGGMVQPRPNGQMTTGMARGGGAAQKGLGFSS